MSTVAFAGDPRPICMGCCGNKVGTNNANLLPNVEGCEMEIHHLALQTVSSRSVVLLYRSITVCT